MRMTWDDAMEPRGSDDDRFKASRALSVKNVPRTRRGWYFIAFTCIMSLIISKKDTSTANNLFEKSHYN